MSETNTVLSKVLSVTQREGIGIRICVRPWLASKFAERDFWSHIASGGAMSRFAEEKEERL
jgi:hypothetical protein